MSSRWQSRQGWAVAVPFGPPGRGTSRRSGSRDPAPERVAPGDGGEVLRVVEHPVGRSMSRWQREQGVEWSRGQRNVMTAPAGAFASEPALVVDVRKRHGQAGLIAVDLQHRALRIRRHGWPHRLGCDRSWSPNGG